MLVNEHWFVGLNEYAERVKTLNKTLNPFIVDEGHNNRYLFLPGLIEELVLNIKYNFTHYNLLMAHGAVFYGCKLIYILY